MTDICKSGFGPSALQVLMAIKYIIVECGGTEHLLIFGVSKTTGKVDLALYY